MEQTFKKLTFWKSEGLLKSKLQFKNDSSPYYNLNKLIKDGSLRKTSCKSIVVHPDILGAFESLVTQGCVQTSSQYEKTNGVSYHERCRRIGNGTILEFEVNSAKLIVVK